MAAQNDENKNDQFNEKKQQQQQIKEFGRVKMRTKLMAQKNSRMENKS